VQLGLRSEAPARRPRPAGPVRDEAARGPELRARAPRAVRTAAERVRVGLPTSGGSTTVRRGSLDVALTADRLANLAEWGYARGLRYFQEGRVASWSASENAVQGVVLGSDEYTARLFTNGRQLGYDCTCPVGDRGQACKHVVALGLTYLAGRGPAPRDERPVFASRRELEAFARERHVEHELQTTAEVLLAELGGEASLRWSLARLNLGAIGSLDGANRYLGA